jgi:hypothetical protein
MLRPFLLMVFLLGMSLFGRAQETLISDTIVMPPVFSGTIGYHIAYTGKVSHEQKRLLPDSMAVYVGDPDIRIRFFGGMSPQLLHEIHWNRTDATFLLLDHSNEAIYVPSNDPPQSPAKLVRPDAEETILEMPCHAYTVATAGERYRIWASDSLFFPINWQDSIPQLRPIFFQAELPSIPLRMQRTRAGITTTTEATSISHETLPETTFQLPSGYTRVAFEGRMSRHPYTADQK